MFRLPELLTNNPDPEAFDGFWYSAEVRHYSVADEWGDHYRTAYRVELVQWAVMRTTPKGVWLTQNFRILPTPVPPTEQSSGDTRDWTYVLGRARKQAAQPTVAAALRDALSLKRAIIRRAEARLRSHHEDADLLSRYIERLPE